MVVVDGNEKKPQFSFLRCADNCVLMLIRLRLLLLLLFVVLQHAEYSLYALEQGQNNCIRLADGCKHI